MDVQDRGERRGDRLHAGLVLDVKGGEAYNGSNVQTYTSNNSRSQQWHLTSIEAPGKIGYQNPSQFFQVSSKNVRLVDAAYSTPYCYVTPSRIDVDATREECVEAFIARAFEYINAPYVWNYSLSPQKGVDCAGLVMQAAYACGMDWASTTLTLIGMIPGTATTQTT